MKEIEITTDYIKLDSFLKLAGIVQTGGQAKIMIAEKNIKVNGEIIIQRGNKRGIRRIWSGSEKWYYRDWRLR